MIHERQPPPTPPSTADARPRRPRTSAIALGLFLALGTAAAQTLNQPPVAQARPLAVGLNTPCSLVLSGSDPDGDPLSYYIVSRPFRGSLSGTAPNLTYTPQTGFTGVDCIYFVVSDGKAISAPAAVNIGINTLTNLPPAVTLLTPSNGTVLAAPASVTLTAAATDADGTVPKVDFVLGSTRLGSATPAPFTFTWSGLQAGTHTFFAKAFDNTGARTFSEPVTVTVTGAPPPVASLTVVNGSGSGSYPANTPVMISAAPALPGQVFTAWTGPVAPVNATASATVIIMPGTNVTVAATYKSTSTSSGTSYQLTVQNGAGSGNYTPGTIVNILANGASPGFAFDTWTGAPVADASVMSTLLTMPATNAVVTATYKTSPGPDPSPSPAINPAPSITNAILFVTQVPIGSDFTTIGSLFGNHRASMDRTGRGGDLFIRYPDGTVRNLTEAAGYGVSSGFQGARSIAVREPSVDWSGQKAVFSMAVGAPTAPFAADTNTFQLYEITHFGQGETPVVTKIPNQPVGFNNVSPCYGTDGRILFTSDRPRNGQRHLYPQLDEYEMAPIVSGIWSLDPATGDLFNLNHTPSGAFSPGIDSFGRVTFVRWDHLQRDQEADLDLEAIAQGNPPPYGTFNYTDEGPTAAVLYGDRTEVYPEPRQTVGNANGHVFNIFFPWGINEDGTEEEVLNHAGRHELTGYMGPSFNDDKNLGYFYNTALRYNTNYVNNFAHVKEDPRNPGTYFGTDAPEFTSHASGQIVSLYSPKGLPADYVTIKYYTDPITKQPRTPPSPTHTGHYREPLPMSDGTLLAIHANGTDIETKRGVGSDYDFRLKTLKPAGTYWTADQPLTTGITKKVSYYSGGGLVNYAGPLWELNPVEVRVRPIPHGSKTPMGAPETQVFNETGVDVAQFQDFLRSNGLALIVSRNVTTRDHADRQQPFNLRIAGTTTQTVGASGRIYDVQHLQIFQGDQIRGFGMRTTNSTPGQGRRVLAQPLHDALAIANNLPNPGGPVGSVQLGADGSMAAMVPTRRAMTWQLTDPAGAPVVRERFWITFQPGEIRTCASCHGVNTRDQANQPAPTNAPLALRTLLQEWKAAHPGQAGSPTLGTRTLQPDADHPIRIGRNAEGALELQWLEGGLESADHVDGPWTPVANSTSPMILPANTASRFYRIKQ